MGFHLTLLVAHALAAVLVYLLARSVTGRSDDREHAALLVALVFAVHPVLTEPVAWITARADVLAGVCLLGTALALSRRPLRLGTTAIAAVLFTAACLFKEVAYAFLPLAWLYVSKSEHAMSPSGRGSPAPGPTQAVRIRSSRRAAWTALATLATLALCASLTLVLRRAALGGLGGDAARTGGSLQTLGGALAFYLARAILPLAPEPYVAVLPGGTLAWAGLGAGLLLAAMAILLMRRERWRIAGLGLTSFLVLLLPSLAPALLRISSIPLADRYLYVPMAFGVLALVPGFELLLEGRGRRWATLGILAVLVLLGATTVSRSLIWHDEVSFWTEASSRDERSVPPRISLATALEARGDHDRAEQIYRELLKGGLPLDRQQSALVHMNLGVVLRATSRRTEARLDLEEAARLDPAQPLVWFNLASVLWELAVMDPQEGTASRAMVEEAASAAGRAVALSPYDPDAWLIRARIVGSLGRYEEARSALTRTIELDPAGEAGETARKLLGLMR